MHHSSRSDTTLARATSGVRQKYNENNCAVMRCEPDYKGIVSHIVLRMTEPSRDDWRNLFDRKRKDVNKIGISIKPLAHIDFTEEVDKLADTEKDLQKELNRLTPGHCKIIDFATAVDKRSSSLQKDDMLSLIWNVSLAVFKEGYSVNLKTHDMVEQTISLDKRLPEFGSIDNGPDRIILNPDLQKPLQDIFVRYVDSHLEMFRMLKASRSFDVKKMDTYFTESGKVFTSSLRKYSELYAFAFSIPHSAASESGANPQFEKINDPKPLGEGGFAKVWRVREVSSQEVYALKRIKTGGGASSMTSPADVKREVRIMRRLSHHHIITLAVATEDEKGFNLYLWPAAECDLRNFLKHGTVQNGSYQVTHKTTNIKYTYVRTQIYQWFGCLVSALDYTHRNKIRHKDIKPANILIHEGGNRVFLTDFGLSMNYSNNDRSRTSGANVPGTQKYQAPECKPGEERTYAVDVFSLGCVFAEILKFLEGSTIPVFDEWRKNQTGSNGDFKHCIEKVKSWLKEGEHPDGIKNVRSRTSNMLEHDVDYRPRAAKLVGKLCDSDFTCCRKCHCDP